jgi:hypothetical protein
MSTFFKRQAVAYWNDLDRSIGALIGIAQGMLSDGELRDREVEFLNRWLEENTSIATAWPGDVLHARVKQVLRDGSISPEERDHLVTTLQQLVGGSHEKLENATHVSEIMFDRDASIVVAGQRFCFTGEFAYGSRSDCERVVRDLGGFVAASVSRKVNYLVVGGLGSPEWIHGSFGTKIVSAIEIKRKGGPVLIVHEDQWAGVVLSS